METNHLPEEIITEILSRLAAKSLLRFKCVSKSWRRLISSKHFVKTHLENSKKNKTFAYHIIVSTASVPSSNRWTIKACSLSSLLVKTITCALPIDYSFLMNYSRNVLLVGSCNGLVCVLVDRSRFFVLNPSTRESKELPDFFSGLKLTLAGEWWGFFCSYGFGFDESSGDYKIYGAYTMTGSRTIARLYSLKAGSWKKVAFFHDGLLSQSLGRFVSGKLHWRRGRGSEWEIVCLDLKSEDMGHVKHPITCLNDDESYPQLGVLNGCLCVHYEYDITKLDIWIWKEYGVEDSWSKFFTIPYLPTYWNRSYTMWSSCTIPLLVLSNDEVLFAHGSIFYVYNTENISVRQWDTVHSYGKCVHEVYVESLVSPVVDGDDVDDNGGEKGRKA